MVSYLGSTLFFLEQNVGLNTWSLYLLWGNGFEVHCILMVQYNYLDVF